MKVKVRISLLNERGESFMGVGLVWLLERIEKYSSIRKAAMDMNMSYAKAHRIIVELEKNLGKKLVERKIGGIEGGGAILTDFGKLFLERYRMFQDDVESYSKGRFQKLKEFLLAQREKAE